MANTARAINHGPLAKRSSTAKTLDFGERKGRISNNLQRLARGQKALFCAHIRKETGNERSSKRCAVIAHTEALNLGHKATARGIEKEFGLSELGVRRRIDAAIKLHLSNGKLGKAQGLLLEYGPKEKAKEVAIMLLEEEIYEGHPFECQREQAISHYQEHYGLSDAEIKEAKISAAARMLAEYAKAKSKALIFGADTVPAKYPRLKEKALSLFSSMTDIEEVIFSAAVKTLTEVKKVGIGILEARGLLEEFDLLDLGEDISRAAAAKLQAQGDHGKAFSIVHMSGILQEDKLGEFSKLSDQILLRDLVNGQDECFRLLADVQMGDPELGKLNEAVEQVFLNLTNEVI